MRCSELLKKVSKYLIGFIVMGIVVISFNRFGVLMNQAFNFHYNGTTLSEEIFTTLLGFSSLVLAAICLWLIIVLFYGITNIAYQIGHYLWNLIEKNKNEKEGA